MSDATGNGHGPSGNGTPTRVPPDDPRLQPYAKHPAAVELVATLAIFLGVLGFVGFGIAYWVADSPQWEAATLGVGLLATGAGLIMWGKYLMPQGPFVEERHPFPSSEEDRAAFSAAVVDRGGLVLRRRKVLGGMVALASAVAGIVLIFPLRSLGPKPGRTLFRTNWHTGSQLVSLAGRPVHVNDLNVGGILTVFPKGFVGSSPDQVVLIRLSGGPDPAPLSPPGKTSWGVAGYVAYSKMCTHLGCPVGLYQEQTQQLVCPCHQSIFDVNSGAIPEFGPAARPLPQLPITANGHGFLVAKAGFDQAVGPGFWERP
ncbi:MAG: Rieske 2Fe-2S domain-containing protein [Acidimicrobiales bacterium]|nr:Rieske 2Fe-2S domain-containing protein [Acidimicrobiales bacterium]